MKRKIVVRSESVTITAVIDTNGDGLCLAEVERIRDALADRLQQAAAGLPYIGTPLNRVRVK